MVNVVLQENLEILAFKVRREFKVLKANVVIQVHRDHKVKKVLSATRERLVNEVREVRLVLLVKRVLKEECLKKINEYSKSC